MYQTLPKDASKFVNWTWDIYEPLFIELAQRQLDIDNVHQWLADWSSLDERLSETYQRLYVAITVNTADEEALMRFLRFLDEIYPKAQAADQELKDKLLESELQPEDFQTPLKNMRAESEIYRIENLPLLAADLKLSSSFDKIVGAETVEWDGQELTVTQLLPFLQERDRAVRERSWRLGIERQLADRGLINALWAEFMDVRVKMAANAGMKSYRDYRWLQLLRFDYTPEDCARFHQAIEEVAVPAAARLYERRRKRLGLDTLRPWDINVDISGQPPLRPYTTVDELEAKTSAVFHSVDSQLGDYFDIMRQEGLLDLDNRKNKAPGGYCTDFGVIRRPFIFANSVGLHTDVQTLLHEGGHAFHVFETASLPYYHQLQVGSEIAEVASMGMELLAFPYLTQEYGGFYTPEQAARARIEHLEESICFWPYMAVVDAFQHWVYENGKAASNPVHCDAKWAELWDRFMVGMDWSGLEVEKATGWQRKPHIHQSPFYYVEYGFSAVRRLSNLGQCHQRPGECSAGISQSAGIGRDCSAAPAL